VRSPFRKPLSRSRGVVRPAGTSKRDPVSIVFTPGSGIGRARRRARALARALRRRGFEPSLNAFANVGDLRRWAETCEPDFSRLVCIGGDATMSAAAAAAIRTGAAFVPVPEGFGNIFAASFHYPERVDSIAALLETGQVRRVDIGLARGPHGADVFLSHRSYGILEQIQNAAERGRKQPRRRLLRYIWYYGVAYRLLFRNRLASFTVEIDGTTITEDASLVTVANVETYRGFLSLTPAASPIDGRFDVAIMGRTSKAALIARLIKLLLRLPRPSGLTVHRGRRVVVTTPRRREELTVSRRALPLLVPPGAIDDLRRRTVEGEQ
jgi:diacylglycerol kinase (ATP)